MERTQRIKERKIRRTRCERCCLWEARARVCTLKQAGWCRCKALQSFLLFFCISNSCQVTTNETPEKIIYYSETYYRIAQEKCLIISVILYGLSPHTQARLGGRLWTSACNITLQYIWSFNTTYSEREFYGWSREAGVQNRSSLLHARAPESAGLPPVSQHGYLETNLTFLCLLLQLFNSHWDCKPWKILPSM